MSILRISLALLPSIIKTQDLKDSDGVANFQRYYKCYFNKYFQIDGSDDNLGRDSFVRELLKEALANNERAPSTACVQWICDTNLLWKIWKPGSLEVWAYYTDIGNDIPSWKTCFQDRYEEFKRQNYTSHPAGILQIQLYYLYGKYIQACMPSSALEEPAGNVCSLYQA